MPVTPLMLDIAEYLQNQMKEQLKVRRPAKTYSGLNKPVSGAYPTPISNKIASGTLYNNLKVFWQEDFNEETATPTLVVDFGAAADYGEYVDEGRRPGKLPPVAPIDKWVRQKQSIRGIRDEKGRFLPRKSLVYLIRRSIGKYGYGGIKFIDKAIEASLQRIQEDMGQAAEDFLINYLEKNGTIIPL